MKLEEYNSLTRGKPKGDSSSYLPLLQNHKRYISMRLNIKASFQNDCENHSMYKII